MPHRTCLILLAVLICQLPARPAAAEVHPRIWVRAADLPRLRSWAVPHNPVYSQGLRAAAVHGKSLMDSGTLPGADNGSAEWEEFPAEGWAQLFAFMSLVAPQPEERADYAARARTLLMHVINAAAACGSGPYCDPSFSTSDRSRWWGDAFGTTVDWIYDSLSAQDKALIRQVFLRWSDENMAATTTDHNHPEPAGLLEDPALLSDPRAVRYSMNNYYTSHMRNLGLMALSFDAADDAGDELRGYLTPTIGAWLYVSDHLMSNDQAGGLGPEGEFYFGEAAGPVAQLLLALHSSGHADDASWGPQASFADSAYWSELVLGLLHGASPRPHTIDTMGFEAYLTVGYGDSEKLWVMDPIDVLGPISVLDQDTGNTERLATTRWALIHMGPGGEDALLDRAADSEVPRANILYFLSFDPQEATPADPRPDLPLTFNAPGTGHLYSRTAWDEDARWLTFQCGWKAVDHQHADANQVQLYRKGEWLTREITGYTGMASSLVHNTMVIENEPTSCLSGEDWAAGIRNSGSQWLFGVNAGDGVILRRSGSAHHLFAVGDATDLYNSDYCDQHDVEHASRSVVWLKPDHVIVYDRVNTTSAGGLKRFQLHFETEPVIDGAVATITTPGGQRLVVTTVLPEDATLSAAQPAAPEPAEHEATRHQLRVDAPLSDPRPRFLHLLHGADAEQSTPATTLILSDDGTFEGLAFGSTVVLLPVDLPTEAEQVSFNAPPGLQRLLVAGMQPGAAYRLVSQTDGSTTRYQLLLGSEVEADGAGMVRWPVGAEDDSTPTGAVSIDPAPEPPGSTTPDPRPPTGQTDPPSAFRPSERSSRSGGGCSAAGGERSAGYSLALLCCVLGLLAGCGRARVGRWSRGSMKREIFRT